MIIGLSYFFNALYTVDRVEKKETLRADILSEGNKTLAFSQKMYHLSLVRGIYTQKEFEAIVQTLSKVSSVELSEVKERYFKAKVKKGVYIIVAFGFTLQEVQSFKKALSLKGIQKGYAFTLSGENRVYPYGSLLSPLLGYTHKWTDSDDFTYRKGAGGLEKYYDNYLSNRYLFHPEGLHLSIRVDLQQKLEKELDQLQLKRDAKEVLSIILDEKDASVIAFASSNRVNPNHIHQEDFPYLRVGAIHYLIELENLSSPIQKALKKEYDELTPQRYEQFGLYESSKIDLLGEKLYDNRALEDIRKFRVNFLQLVRAYSVFYMGGEISEIKIAKHHKPLFKKRVLSSEGASRIKKELKDFFQDNSHRAYPITTSKGRDIAYISMREFSYEDHRYLQAYCFIQKASRE